MSPDVAFNTAVSFVTNTNWQAYAGETGASHLIQMAGFTWQNFISAATGIAVAIALDPRAHPQGGPRDRQLLGRPHAGRGSTCCCRSASCSRSSTSRRACRRRSPVGDGHDRRGRDAADPRRAGRVAGGDQGARHERRRLLQRQLRAPVREPDPVHRLPPGALDPRDPRRAHVHVREDGGQHEAGRRRVRGDGAPVRDERRCHVRLRAGRQPEPDAGGGRPGRLATQTGGNMEGKEVRFGIESSALYGSVTTVASNGAVNGSMSSMTPLSGRHGDAQHRARRGGLRRRRGRASTACSSSRSSRCSSRA